MIPDYNIVLSSSSEKYKSNLSICTVPLIKFHSDLSKKEMASLILLLSIDVSLP